MGTGSAGERGSGGEGRVAWRGGQSDRQAARQSESQRVRLPDCQIVRQSDSQAVTGREGAEREREREAQRDAERGRLSREVQRVIVNLR